MLAAQNIQPVAIALTSYLCIALPFYLRGWWLMSLPTSGQTLTSEERRSELNFLYTHSGHCVELVEEGNVVSKQRWSISQLVTYYPRQEDPICESDTRELLKLVKI